MNSAEIITTYKNTSGTTIIKTEVNTGTFEENIEDENIPGGTIDQVYPCVVQVANLKAFGIGCKRSPNSLGVVNEGTTQIIVKTFDGATLVDTITITPSNGVGWSLGDPNPCPLTGDFDSIKISNIAPVGSTAAIAKMDITGRFLIA